VCGDSEVGHGVRGGSGSVGLFFVGAESFVLHEFGGSVVVGVIVVVVVDDGVDHDSLFVNC